MAIQSFSTDMVRDKWQEQQRMLRSAYRTAQQAMGVKDPDDAAPYYYVKEVWTDHLIIEGDGPSYEGKYCAKIPYTVSDDNEVSFGQAIPVKQEYVELAAENEDGLLWTSPHGSAVTRMLELANREFSTKTREKYAKKGVAESDGSYPIPDKDALRRAIQSFGRSKNPEKTKRHIIARAKALGATDMLPEGWV